MFILVKALNIVYTSGITTPKQGCVLAINVTNTVEVYRSATIANVLRFRNGVNPEN